MRREIRYPIFLKFSLLTDDVFWQFLYEDMSIGRFPIGVHMQKDYLCCGVKGKEFVHRLAPPGTSTERYFAEVHALLKDRLGLLCEKDAHALCQAKVQDCQNEYERMRQMDPSSSVSLFRKKIIQETLLQEYVLSLRSKYHLSFSVLKQILSLIIVGLLFKTLHLKHLQIDNGKLAGIDGVKWTHRERAVPRSLFLPCAPTHFAVGTPTDAQWVLPKDKWVLGRSSSS